MIADLGCGNGKYLKVLPDDLIGIGSDISVNLLKCNTHEHSVFVADSVYLPLRDNSFDYAISIAVIHHLSTEAARLSAIKEMIRIIRPGG
jgi:ubiquinone/menaquinone biosynthesis C-methylase UbiE